GTQHALGAGDCLGFGPPAETTFANESNTACTYVVALARSRRMSPFAIKPLEDSPQIRSALAQLLVETVANGGSVSFMHPLPTADAEAFWKDSLASAARGERIV